MVLRQILWICLFVSVFFNGDAAYGQDFPRKPIRIVTSGVGGSPDFVARLVAPGISASLGQSVVVDNRANLTAFDTVSKAVPDGYTLLLGANSVWVGSLLQDVPYDPVRNLSPISLINTQPNVLVVSPSLPVKSVKELIALAKSKPGELNYASSVTGSANHLAAELFNFMAGVKIQRVPYKSIGVAMSDLLGGHIQLSFPGAGGAMSLIKSGKLQALAVTGVKPSELLPDLPTIAQSGVPGYESVVVSAVLAPAKTPPVIIARLNRDIVQFLRRPEVKEKFLNAGAEVVGSSPEELAATIKSELARIGMVIKTLGIRAED